MSNIGVGDEARLYSPRLRLDTGDRYRLFRKTTKYSVDKPKQMSGEFANKRDRIGKMLTRATRDLSTTTNTPQGFKNTTQYGGNAENFAAEVGGSTFRSAEMSFYIDDDAFILDAQLRFVVTGYRTYERDTAAASSSTPTSAGDNQLHRHAFGTPLLPQYLAGHNVNQLIPYAVASVGVIALTIEDVDDPTADLVTGTAVTAHQHTVTVAAHSHTQVYNIFESTSAPGPITVKFDSVNINSRINGPFVVSLGTVVDVSLTGIVTSPGWHTLRFETASGLGRVTPYVLVRSLQLQP